MSENDLETHSISRANEILKSIRDFRVKIDPTKATDSLEISRIGDYLNEYEVAESKNICISENTADLTIAYYNRLLSRGAIVENQISQKQFEDLQMKYEKVKKERDQLEGKLSEYRRMYSPDDTLVGDVTSD